MTLITTACIPRIPSAIPISASIPAPIPTSTRLDERVDVGGYKLRILCTGQGTPAVIIDPSLGLAGVESGAWMNVRHGIEKTTRICAYDRAGLGTSDPPPTKPRTSEDMVKDLHNLLVNANVPGPYILVGHSIGGYNVRLYASKYPNEVVGIVLVDSSHPDQIARLLSVLPPESPDEPNSPKEMRQVPDPSSNLEKMNLLASADQARAVKTLGDLPLVVVTRSPTWVADSNLPPDVEAQIDQLHQELQNELAGLSSNSTHIIATKAGHHIEEDEPQLIIDAILKVIEEEKK